MVARVITKTHTDSDPKFDIIATCPVSSKQIGWVTCQTDFVFSTHHFTSSEVKLLVYLKDDLSSIKSGRATGDVFDDLMVKAYGEMQPFSSLCQTIVRGNQLLTVKVFDDSVLDEVLKTLVRCDMDIDVQLEGKDIKVKMGLGKKEHAAQAISKIKGFGDESKITLR